MFGKFERTFRFLSLPFFCAAAVAVLPACQVKYRRDVEKPGTPAKYTYSAGGFIRYDGYDDVAGDLEIAVREYEKPGSNSKLRLVGVIHIGDVEYYRTLQKEQLDTADVVLFEGVKFEGEGVEPPDLGGVYGAMGTLLGIGFQKDGINYRAENFVHCDVTVGPGDPLSQQVDPAMVNQAAQMMQPLASAKMMLTAGGDPRRTEDALKHGMVSMMAMQMGGMDDRAAAEKAAEQLGAQGGQNDMLKQRAEKAIEALKKVSPDGFGGMSPEMQREILDRRNAHVIKELEARLKADGDEKAQTIAIFYGAAHNPGLEKDMMAWGYRPTTTTWYKAWRMNGAGQPIRSEKVEHPAGSVTVERPAQAHPQPKPEARPGRRRGEPVLY